MCGILFHAHLGKTLNTESEIFVDFLNRLKDANARRGPDVQQQLDVSIKRTDDRGDMPLHFFASELQLRGTDIARQPHHDIDDQNVLCWNGEIFEGIKIAPDENDGIKLFSLLLETRTVKDITWVFANLEGPYAFVYYENGSKRLYFGRDPLGRRSLLIHKPTAAFPVFILCSVSVRTPDGLNFEALSSDRLFSLDLHTLSGLDDPVPGFNHTLRQVDPNVAEGAEEGPFAAVPKVNAAVPDDQHPLPSLGAALSEYLQTAVDGLVSQLERSVMLQVKSITSLKRHHSEASVGVLFSGGIDSAVLAFLADRYVPADEPIDLLNVAFENPRKQAKNQNPNRKKKNARNAGGEVERTHAVASDSPTTYFVPDRETGLEGLAELRRLCPHRIWNFIEVDVPFEESQSARPLVEELMFPCQTVMDLSLAIALYFASKGIGTIQQTPESPKEPYTSPAKVLLNGLGPDELLGGYGRYKTVFSQHGGWPRVVEELQMDLSRIPVRNLGRDDRVISSHGKEVRHPFLSLPFVKYVAELPVHYKLDPRLELGVGDKMVLRLAAKQLGLVEASTRKKRAMQFGSHSARMQGGEAERKGGLPLREHKEIK